MSEVVRCPDCGHPNAPGSERCLSCNFPLASDHLVSTLSSDHDPASGAKPISGPAPASGPASTSGSELSAVSAPTPDPEPSSRSESRSGPQPRIEAPAPIPRPLRPIRPRRPKPASNQVLSLWLLFGAVCAAAVVYIAIKANVDRVNQPIEGASSAQTGQADEFRAALAKDSTNVDALIGLGNVYYDTANWPEAIRQYRAALRRDSSRVSALVDLGVCYYNTGNSKEAEHLFELTLVREPHHPVALFNLGIVTEGRKDYDAALSYFHRALQNGPPEEMKQPILEAMQRVQKASQKSPPPLPR